MNNFDLCTPTRFVFGHGVVELTGRYVAELGFRKALLVFGQGSVVKNGTLGRVKASLQEAGVEVFDLAGVRPNPEVATVRTGIDFARAKEVDVVLAVGGGSTIDCCKAIACGCSYDGDVWDFFSGKVKPADVEPLPVAAVLTIPAAGSEASDSCVISNDEHGLKRGMNGDKIRPKLAIMEPEVTFTLPQYQTAAGATDMIAHICERWFSGAGAVPVTDSIAAGLIRSIMEAANVVKEDPENYEARATLMWAGTLAHDGLCGAGRNLTFGKRAGGWESHGLEHELSAFDPNIAHGAGLAVIMPAWMRYVWREDPQRFLDFGKAVFGIKPDEPETVMAPISSVTAPKDLNAPVQKAVEATIDALQAFFTNIGMPSKLGELGIGEEDVDAIVGKLEQTKGAEFGAFKKLNMADAKNIYLSAF